MCIIHVFCILQVMIFIYSGSSVCIIVINVSRPPVDELREEALKNLAQTSADISKVQLLLTYIRNDEINFKESKGNKYFSHVGGNVFLYRF